MKKERKKKEEETGQNIISASAAQGGINNCTCRVLQHIVVM